MIFNVKYINLGKVVDFLFPAIPWQMGKLGYYIQLR